MSTFYMSMKSFTSHVTCFLIDRPSLCCNYSPSCPSIHGISFSFYQIAMEGTEGVAPPREIQILETAEDIQERREQVLNRYAAFKDATRTRRERLEDARKFMYFKRDADELESWINEKLQTASDESYRDPTNLQVRA